MTKYSNLIFALLIAIALAIFATTPPEPVGADAPPQEFSAARAMEDIRVIAAEPHPTGSEANAKVREYLIARLEAMGLEITTTTGPISERAANRLSSWLQGDTANVQFTNVIGVLPGTDRDAESVLLMAHYDSVGGSAGASDDASGVGSILETVRAIQSRGQTNRDIVLFFTDAEEIGLVGARQFFAFNPLADSVGAVINLEARGGGGRTTLFQTSSQNGGAAQFYADSVARPAGSSLATFVYEALPNDTDLTPALERDYIAYNFGFIGRPGLYHSPDATPERLDQGSVQDMGAQTLDLTSALANADALPEKSENRTFFDVFGLFVMSYGTAIGWALLAIAAILQIFCLQYNPVEKGWLRNLGASAVVILGGGALLFGLNELSGAGPGELVYYDRLAAIPMLEIQALLTCIAVLAASAPLWAGRTGSLVGLLAAIGLQLYAPVTSFLVVWPLLLSGVAGVLAHRLSGIWSSAAKVVPGAIVLGFLLQYGHQLMQGVGPDAPYIVAFLAALMLPALGLLVPSAERRVVFPVAAVLLILATVIALWVRLDPIADTVALYAQ
ncbi:M20/M25/M40 family metallo-hydrolase [Pontixanthobacter aestiaquae]|uniref:Vacuolar membrane protease n=1 Tax=Pontixanthobacter aestiaquae TaxID=1509367 RepID=A0A844Z8U8_9SPHN|nr:M28 family peptidase [Pontixanthobacter aestiaquae]MDN3645505.1 M20/M25/M40 family metallo-hydrolase [Pontixanthobacter aestiaquae]MXO83497.1 M20/M25/M40 family metallo-hydrolase [Pontixanthobacter aestiaquae]